MLIGYLMMIGAFSLIFQFIVLLLCIAIGWKELRRPPVYSKLQKPQTPMVYRRPSVEKSVSNISSREAYSLQEEKPAPHSGVERRKALDTRPRFQSIDDKEEASEQIPALLPARSPLALLKVLQGTGLKNEYPIFEDNFSIGRAKTSKIILNDERVSRNHAVIRTVNQQWFIQDKDSVNGILVNGERVKASKLANGDEITIATYVFRFEIVQ
jgi:hypothetical protein